MGAISIVKQVIDAAAKDRELARSVATETVLIISKCEHAPGRGSLQGVVK
jgi:hypothetical protein